MNGGLSLRMLSQPSRILLSQQGTLKICVGEILNLPKGGGKLPPPFLFKRAEGFNKLIVLIQKVFFVSFSLFHRLRRNLLNAGWLGSVMNAFRKSKTLNWL